MRGSTARNQGGVLTMTHLPVENYLTAGREEAVSFWWLGQAGFLFRGRDLTILVDAYLSDALAEKYSGTQFPHLRMMEPPLQPGELVGIDAVLCSHSHSDHMDPGLLPAAAAGNPDCVFIMPEAARHVGRARGVPDGRIIGMDAGETAELANGVTVSAIPAAHESLAVDVSGKHLFLGYLLQFSGITFYHSGDCVPYPALERYLDQFAVDVQLLPVNGRSRRLTESGFAGNFTFEEALHLMEKHDITYMIAHHFGMFAFNTADVARMREKIEESGKQDRVFPAQTGIRYSVSQHALTTR